ncbi:MAG: hypothetical protein WDZ26_03395 [Nitriliruptoraceae bacterium]
MRRTVGFVIASAVVVALAAATVAWQRPDVRLRVTAAAVALEALDILAVPWCALAVQVETTTVAGTTVDRHVSDEMAPIIVLVPGATRHGRADPRTREVAHAIARRGRTVVIPELDVYREQLVGHDVDRLVAVVEELARDGARVTLGGISFAGALALLAASDLEVDARTLGQASPVALVATFGAYVDLIEVTTAVLVGESRVGDQSFTWEPDTRSRDVVRAQVMALLEPSARDVVEAAVAGDLDLRLVPEDLRAVIDLLTATTWSEATDATRRLPSPMVARLHEMSPARVGDHLDTPVVAMHARRDPVIPFAELIRLGQQQPQAELLALEGFGHVDRDAGGGLRATVSDARTAWSFAFSVLESGT